MTSKKPTDKQRLEWVLKPWNDVYKIKSRWYAAADGLHDKIPSGRTPRAAIDAAIAAEKKGVKK